MAAQSKTVNSPHSKTNYMLPSRISAWFTPDGAMNPFELGDIEDLSIDLSEDYLEKDSAREGIQSAVHRVVTKLNGEIGLGLTEIVRRNLELLFRSQTITNRTAGNSNMVVLYEGATVTLTGTTATNFAGQAREGIFDGVIIYRDATVLRVTNETGDVEYNLTTDYTVTAANEGTSSAVTQITVAGATCTAGQTLVLTHPNGTIYTLTCGTEFDDGATATNATNLAASIAAAINELNSPFFAESTGADLDISYRTRDGVNPAPLAVTGTELIADMAASASHTFSGAVATTQTTITRVAGGAIPSGSTVRIDYSFEREACSYSLQDGSTIEGALQIQILSVSGPQCAYQFYRTSAGINGALTADPASFAKAAMTFKILTDGLGRRGTFHLLKRHFGTFVDPQGACI